MKIDPNQIRLKNLPQFFNVMMGLGFISAIASIIGLFVGDANQFYYSSLTSGIFAVGIPLGALFFVLIHFLVGAKWSTTTRRIAEVMSATGPYVALLLAVVILAGANHLYSWSRPEVMAKDHALHKKAAYLNMNFFVIRLAAYIIIWTLLSRFFLKSSLKGDAANFEADLSKAKAISPIGIILFAVTVTFAAFDWIMSLDPHWYSTIFGVYIFSGFVVSFFATIILVCRVLQTNGYLKDIVTIEHYHDHGKLMFAFTCFWAFCAFSQYMLIWYGNIPEETIFYSHRWVGAWKYISLILPIGHFAIPFVLLMARPAKRNLKFLSFMAVWLLVLHFVDLHWLILPNLHHEGFCLSWLDITTWVGFTGIFFGILGRLLTKVPLIPLNDPTLDESIHHVSR